MFVQAEHAEGATGAKLKPNGRASAREVYQTDRVAARQIAWMHGCRARAATFGGEHVAMRQTPDINERRRNALAGRGL
jgi:hypothetical protein